MKSSADAPRFVSRLLPSLTGWLWFVLLLTLLAQPWRTTMLVSDGDACMHWRCGEWMLQNRQLLRADSFSHTRLGVPATPKEWLAQITFALAGRQAGLTGLAVVGALLIATALALVHRQLIREGNDALVATLVTLLAAWASSAHWLARPHAFSFVLAALWCLNVRRLDRGEPRATLALAGITALWVNLHGAYLAGFLLLGAYWLGAFIERDRLKLRRFTVAGIVCAMASLLNPSGIMLHVHNLGFLRSGYFRDWLAEYASIRFDSPDALGFAVWLALMFLTLAICRPRLRAGEKLALLSWTYFALYAARNIPLLVIFTAPILAPALSQAARARWPALLGRLHNISTAGRGGVILAGIAAICIIFVPRPVEFPAKDWPVAAVEFIRAHPDDFAGNMFNQYMWGGYLLQYLPEHKTFVDGRSDFFGEELVKEFTATAGLHTNWPAALEKYRVAWTLMPREHRLNSALALAPAWHLAFSNETALIYRRSL